MSYRAQKVLAAIRMLPEGTDGWRRATYRDQLHLSVGLSRGGVARTFASGELDGLVEVQGVGRSARTPEGYRLTPRGVQLDRVGAGSIQPDPAPRSSSDPVLDSVLVLSSQVNKKNQDKNQDWIDPAPIQPQRAETDPAPPASHSQRLALDDQTLSVLYAAMTQTPLCACVRPMHAKQQAKSGAWFWGCMHGRKGCGMTCPMRWQPKAPQRAPEPGKRDMSNLTLDDVIRRTADKRRA
jgi:hypothetical protein